MDKLIERLRAGPDVRDLEDGSGGWEMDPGATGKTMHEAADKLEAAERENAELRAELKTASQLAYHNNARAEDLSRQLAEARAGMG